MALKALYQYDLLGEGSREDVLEFCAQGAGPPVAELALELVEACIQHQQTLDEVIRQTAENWELERMATSDRNILRLGVCELLFRQQTPPKVAINEAIELAKRYSTEKSSTFVNGVLDRIYNTRVVGRPAPEDAVPDDPPEMGATSRVPAVAQEAEPHARADLHVHSTASDGSVDPGDLAALAARAGLMALALTDHDSVEGVAAAREAAEAVGIELVPGVELTAYAPSRSAEGDVEIHIAGLFVDAAGEALRGRLRELRAARVERIKTMAARLQELGMDVDSAQVLRRARGAAVGRMHMAQEMVERGFCKDLREAFNRYIGAGCPAYVPKEKLTPLQAIDLVKAAGGCSVLCHPGLTEGIEHYMAEFVERGLDGLEVHCPMHTTLQEKDLLEMARRFGLLVSGGSDFHGAAKPDIHVGQEAVSFVDLEQLRRRASVRA